MLLAILNVNYYLNFLPSTTCSGIMDADYFICINRSHYPPFKGVSMLINSRQNMQMT